MDFTRFSKRALTPQSGENIALEHPVLDRPCSLSLLRVRKKMERGDKRQCCLVEEYVFGSRGFWVKIPALPLTSYVTLSRFLNLSEPQGHLL